MPNDRCDDVTSFFGLKSSKHLVFDLIFLKTTE